VPVVLDFGAGGDGKTEIGEDFSQFVHHLADRVDAATRGVGRGQRKIDRFVRQPGIKRGLFQRGLAQGDGGGDRFAQGVDLWPFGRALIGAHRAQGLEQARDRPLLAQEFDPQLFERIEVARARDAVLRVLSGACVVHWPVRSVKRLGRL